jgi:enterochelin esterase family protein
MQRQAQPPGKERKAMQLKYRTVVSVMSLLFLAGDIRAQQKWTATQLIDMAKINDHKLASALEEAFSEKDLKNGKAFLGHGPDFILAIEAASEPKLVIDDNPAVAMTPLEKGKLWYATVQILPVASVHSFHYLINGAPYGGDLDVPGFGPLSYLQPGVPSGALSEKLIYVSKIYDGMKAPYWIYVPAQYDPKTPAALMVFQDGGGYLDRDGHNPGLNVIDNLIAQKKMPVTICVFVSPGDISGSVGTPTYDFVARYSKEWNRDQSTAMRSVEYDTVSDRYERFLHEELLAEIGKKYNIRQDAYSRAITGGSSGGIAAFNAAWQAPNDFSRVISWIGSFTAMQWKEQPGIPDGGQDYFAKVLREPKRNIRVWLQDGSNDMEVRWGSWPLSNITMANALKQKDYDFHLSFGKGTHNSAQGAAEFPESMIWLWRDYDPTKTEQTYEQDPAEKRKPPFRVAIVNRN